MVKVRTILALILTLAAQPALGATLTTGSLTVGRSTVALGLECELLNLGSKTILATFELRNTAGIVIDRTEQFVGPGEVDIFLYRAIGGAQLYCTIDFAGSKRKALGQLKAIDASGNTVATSVAR